MNTLRIQLEDAEYNVEYDYGYDPGLDIYPNGDPGYPSWEDIDIKSVKVVGSELNLWGVLTGTQVGQLKDKISDFERNYAEYVPEDDDRDFVDANEF